eukprot:scaffold169044_cov19-Tisochrysis_lutea.AAC.1
MSKNQWLHMQPQQGQDEVMVNTQVSSKSCLYRVGGGLAQVKQSGQVRRAGNELTRHPPPLPPPPHPPHQLLGSPLSSCPCPSREPSSGWPSCQRPRQLGA